MHCMHETTKAAAVGYWLNCEFSAYAPWCMGNHSASQCTMNRSVFLNVGGTNQLRTSQPCLYAILA